MNCSNSFRLTSFFVPTNKTKGQLGLRSILSILLIQILLYYAASLVVSAIFRLSAAVFLRKLSPSNMMGTQTSKMRSKMRRSSRSAACFITERGIFVVTIMGLPDSRRLSITSNTCSLPKLVLRSAPKSSRSRRSALAAVFQPISGIDVIVRCSISRFNGINHFRKNWIHRHSPSLSS